MREFPAEMATALARTKPFSRQNTQIVHMSLWLGRPRCHPEALLATLKPPSQAFPPEGASAISMVNPATNSLLSTREFTDYLIQQLRLLTYLRYFANHNPPYAYYSSLNGIIGANSGIYNRIGRGFPDVAAVGDNAALVVNGFDAMEGGISMSAPVKLPVQSLGLVH
jgi:hypothetical protein